MLPTRAWAILPALLLLTGAAWLATAHNPRQALAWLLGGAFGLVLFLASFSFAAGFRQLLAQRRTLAVRAQLLLLAATTALLLPAITIGPGMRGLVFPTGLATLVGAFLFGLGMQLGGGCGSGSLYAAGAGRPRMEITLLAFIAGATMAAWQAPLWSAWPSLPPIALPDHLGPWPTLLATLTILAVAYVALYRLERARHGHALPLSRPLLLAALALAILNLATLALLGRPWAITAAFPLWGAKAIHALGLDDPAFWPFWEDPTRTEAILRPLAADPTTAMDLGIMAGALLAATATGRLLRWSWPGTKPVLASLLGGLLLGIGAVLASGCNISAWVGGTASGSLHGWAWIAPALAGNYLGLKLRPVFRLAFLPAPQGQTILFPPSSKS